MVIERIIKFWKDAAAQYLQFWSVSISSNSVDIGTLLALLGVKQVYRLSRHWLPLGYCHAVVFCCLFIPHVLFLALHTLQETITLSSYFICRLFHNKWELCLFRSPLQLNTHVIQARDKMEKLSFFQIHLASNLSNKHFTTLSWHLIEEPIRSHSGLFHRVKPKWGGMYGVSIGK